MSEVTVELGSGEKIPVVDLVIQHLWSLGFCRV